MSSFSMHLHDGGQITLDGYPFEEDGLRMIIEPMKEWCGPNGEVYPRKADAVSVPLTDMEALLIGAQLMTRSGMVEMQTYLADDE
jgi:hypothetical protein